MRGLIASASCETSTPRTDTSPPSGWRSPSRISTVVVLPAPLGPSRPKISPLATSKSMPSTAWTSPYRFVRPRTRMTGPPAAVVVIESELLAQIGRDGRVVAHRFVKAIRLGAVVAGRDLDESGSELPGHEFGLGHEPMTDTTLTGAGVDHEREDADDAVVVLEPRQGVERDEPQHRALVFRDHDTRVLGREPAEPLDDVARTGWISLIGEEG